MNVPTPHDDSEAQDEELKQQRAPRNGRARIAEMGAATRQAIARANRAKLSVGEHRVFLAVLWHLTAYTKLTDRVYVGQIADETGGLSHEWTRQCLLKLAKKKIIIWEPRRGRASVGRGGGRGGEMSLVGLLPALNTKPKRFKHQVDLLKTPSPGLGMPEKTAPEEKAPEEKALSGAPRSARSRHPASDSQINDDTQPQAREPRQSPGGGTKDFCPNFCPPGMS